MYVLSTLSLLHCPYHFVLRKHQVVSLGPGLPVSALLQEEHPSDSSWSSLLSCLLRGHFPPNFGRASSWKCGVASGFGCLEFSGISWGLTVMLWSGWRCTDCSGVIVYTGCEECGVLCRCCLCCWFWIGVLMLVGGCLGVLLGFVVDEAPLGWDCKISTQSCTRSSSKFSSTSEFSTSTILDRSNVFCSARTFRCCCLSSLFLSFSFCFSLLAAEASGRFFPPDAFLPLSVTSGAVV